MRLIDLTMPIQPHFRWRPETSVKGDLGAGDQYRITTLTASVHSFSHVDARRHMLADGETIEATPLERVVGWFDIIDLTDVQPDEAIGTEKLGTRGAALTRGGKALLKSCWETRRDPQTPEFWTEAPYLTRDAALWLREREITTVAYDFPQDWPIRLSLTGETAPFEQHVTHDILLRENVTMIEYLANTKALSGDRVFLVAAPLKIVGADGAPARIFAIEGLAPPARRD